MGTNQGMDLLGGVTVRVLLADDCQPWRRFVFSMLQGVSELQVICEAADGVEVIQKSQELRPDLILLDIGLPKLNGIEAARQIRYVAPKVKILFLSQHLSPEIFLAALNAGGNGYVVKSDAGSELLVAIKAVLQGSHFVSARLVRQGWPCATDDHRVYHLSKRRARLPRRTV